MYGTQTLYAAFSIFHAFENDVKMYGTQTSYRRNPVQFQFENDVKMYGTQTDKLGRENSNSLRMM